MTTDNEIWRVLRKVETDVVILKTKMQGIWWAINIVGGSVLLYVANKILKG